MFVLTLIKTAFLSTLIGGSWAAPIPLLARQNQACSAAGGNCATYYDPGLGACGDYNGGSEMVVAMNAPAWNGGSDCGRWVRITASNGKTVQAKVVDLCPVCGVGSLDLSRPAFNAISEKGLDPGVIPISYEFIDGPGNGAGNQAGQAPPPQAGPVELFAEPGAWTPEPSYDAPAWTPEPVPAPTPTTSTAAAESSTPATAASSESSAGAPSERAPTSTEGWEQPPAATTAAPAWPETPATSTAEDVESPVSSSKWSPPPPDAANDVSAYAPPNPAASFDMAAEHESGAQASAPELAHQYHDAPEPEPESESEAEADAYDCPT